MVASVNALARMLFTMAREGVLPEWLGRAHPRHHTPYAGILAIAPLLFVVPLVMQQVANADAASTFTYIATPATFGFMFAYVLIGAGAPWLVHRATGVSNITPTPPWPLDMMPYLFAALMVVGGIVYAAIRARDGSVTDRIGTVEELAGSEQSETLVTKRQLI
jgi:amino acid transporter